MPAIDFFKRTGQMAIGSRLRMLTDKITEDAGRIFTLYGVSIKPKWFPVFFVLSQGKTGTVTDIAKEIGHSHPSVSKIVREMLTGGLVQEIRDETDKRRNVIMLSSQGQLMAEAIKAPYADVTEAIERISEETQHDLWEALGEWEQLLEKQPLIQRVREVKKARESKSIAIVPYEPRYQPVFRSLNEEWITAHWQMEKSDYKALDHPQEYILDKGGYIFVALDAGAPVGVCALCKLDDPDYDYELAKLAVSPKAQGKGIGILLGETVIRKAMELGAQKIFLESNTILEPATHLYRKLGFQELKGHHLSYARGNIQMKLTLVPFRNKE
ncbi:bifunctional helix-turn-helix transcriptional regulator/GNAT family N-acetyltransferase [Akkermansia sp. N21116]|nr:bifunctional helix-turn-helix transcriptional regulator/GNAT family N-acetyltransferase [Akkermansia sp. N21116]WPX41548.1 bifunctional helix-turn-helix transcriptional regulator/GNAT family N-acetyltransferase [Akkermansia sp. N21116]